MPVLQTSVVVPTPLQPPSLSWKATTVPSPLSLHSNLALLSLRSVPVSPKTMPIRMGGGPRTYPGGVSKWQWKRMQAKKAKQLLKARLCRERQIYEMRKRAELKAAVAELERPWEPVEKPPNLFSVSADEQLKVLADRFQKPGWFDLWTDRDGPQLFKTVDDLPSARFFPKGVVHSVKPYKRVSDESKGGAGSLLSDGENTEGKHSGEKFRAGYSSVEEDTDGSRAVYSSSKKSTQVKGVDGQAGEATSGRWRKKGSSRKLGSMGSSASGGTGSRHLDPNKDLRSSGRDAFRGLKHSQNGVYDMSLQQDGRYGYQQKGGLHELDARAR